MLTQTESQMELLIYEALDSERGLVIGASSVERFKQLFYRTRAKMDQRSHPALRYLSIRTSPTDPRGEVFMMKAVSAREVPIDDLEIEPDEDD